MTRRESHADKQLRTDIGIIHQLIQFTQDIFISGSIAANALHLFFNV